MQLKKRVFSVIMVLALVLGMMPQFVMVAAAEANDGYGNIISGEYKFMCFKKEYTGTFYYTDEYFDKDSSAKDTHFRTMSAALAFSTMQADSSDYVQDILTQIGFGDIKSYDMDLGEKTGVTFAHKKIGDDELAVVAIRGGEYTNEWRSNLTIGADGDIKGFSDSAKDVRTEYDAYTDETSITPNKIWVVGYSRGGAVADLFGRSINQDASSLGFQDEDIYVYTFEAPHTTLDDTTYTNIHNCIDENDLVVYAVPDIWGTTNCGVKEVINTSNKKLKKKKLDFVKLITGDKNVFENDGVTTYANYISDTMNWIAGNYITREIYVSKFEPHLNEVADIFMYRTDEDFDGMGEYFENNFASQLEENTNKYKLAMIATKAMTGDEKQKAAAREELKSLLFGILREDKANVYFTGDDLDTLESLYDDISEIAMNMAIDDLFGSETRKGNSDLYQKAKKEYAKEKDTYAIEKIAKTDAEKELWYRGFDEGYDAGYGDGESEKDYVAEPESVPSDIDVTDIYTAGYRFGYYDAYTLAVTSGEVEHPLTRIATAITGAGDLVACHYPNNNIELLESTDSYYKNPPTLGDAGNSATASIFSAGDATLVIITLLACVIAVETIYIFVIKSKKSEVRR